MGWPATIAIGIVAGGAGYFIGFDRGQEAAPGFLEELERKHLIREEADREFMAIIEQLQYDPPTVEECVPVMEGKEIDVFEFCYDFVWNDQESYQRYLSDDDRDPIGILP